MAKAPGHEKWPDHQIREELIPGRVRVEVRGEVVADSDQVIRVDEDRSPARYYFPRSDVQMAKLERTQTTTECPFKGTAHYFNLLAGDETLKDAVWTYEEPYEEHAALKDRLAFWDERFPALEIRTR